VKKLPLILIPVFIFSIVFVGWVPSTFSRDFPPEQVLMEVLRQRDPPDFLESLEIVLQTGSLDGNDLCHVWEFLETISRNGSHQDMATAEGVKGCILINFGYLKKGLEYLDSGFRKSIFASEKESLLIEKAKVQKKLGDIAGLASTEKLLQDFEKKQNSASSISVGNSGSFQWPKTEEDLKDGKKPSFGFTPILIWFLLLAWPFLTLEIQRKRFLWKYPEGTNRAAAFTAFRSSPLTVLLCLASAIFLYLFKIPQLCGFSRSWVVAFVHLFISFSLCLWVHYRLDREIRKTGWSFWAFWITIHRLNLFSSFPLLVFFAAIFCVRQMAFHLPLWPIFSPIGVGLAFPAIAAAILLFSPLFFPILFGFSRLSEKKASELATGSNVKFYSWELHGSSIYNGLSFGYLPRTQGIALTSPLWEKFSIDEIKALIAHEEAHLVLGHIFYCFVIFFDAVLIAGLYAAKWPAETLKMLIIGPSLLQIFGFFIGFLVFSTLFRNVSRKLEFEADEFAARKVGREVWLNCLEKLSRENFFPVHWREGDEQRMTHPSLAARKKHLRTLDGKFFEPAEKPSTALLAALWRSRLAIEWKCGELECVELCSLDDDLEGIEPDRVLLELAKRHVKFGAECLVADDSKKLEILACPQKACADSVIPPLPREKICALCNAGMRKAIGIETQWSSTDKGCILVIAEAKKAAF